MLLSQFNGGLNTNIAPHLIGINEGTNFTNIDNSSISLKPFNGPTATAQNFGSGQSFTYFKGQWISNSLGTSYVKYNDVLYYTTGNGNLMKTKDGLLLKEVGLTAPATAPTIANTSTVSFSLANKVTGDVSDIPAGSYTYIFLYYTSDVKYNYETIDFEYTGTQGIEATISVPTSVTKVMLYRLYDSTYRLVGTFNGTTLDDITYDISLNAAYSFLQYSELADVRQYCYTFYNIDDGTESAPSPVSEELSILTNSVYISDLKTTLESATHIRIYRLGGDLSNFTLVDELALGTETYTDTKPDIDIADSELLTTQGLRKPPEDMNYLTEYSSTLFGAVDNTLWFSDSGLVDKWSKYNYIDFPDTITGLGATQNGLLVFSKNQTHIIIGTTIDNFAKILMHNSQGCVAHLTIQYVNNVLIWQSLDGICVSNGSSIELISETKLGKLDLSPIASAVYDTEYYLFHDTGCLIVEKNAIFKTLDLIVQGAYYSPDFDLLYYINPDDNGMYSFNTDTDNKLTYTYKTGWLADNGLTNVKVYKTIYLFCDGEIEVKCYIDGVLVTTQTLVAGFNELKLPSTSLRGYYAELEFTGSAMLREVEFKTEGRQNGR